VPEAFRAATGKLPTFVSGSTKWDNIVASANFYIRKWAREPDVDWNSLYNPVYSLGTVSATNTFDLDDEILSLSKQEDDPLTITHVGGTQYSYYDLVNADKLHTYRNGHYAAQVGRTIRFNAPFTSTSQQFGGAITVPVYVMPDAVSADGDEIPVDDVNWLILVVAADYVRNDITRKDLRADLISEANDAMQAMKENNDSQVSAPLTSWNPTAHTSKDEC
jgi:hypothetical protein